MSQIRTKPTGPRPETKAAPANLLPADHLEEVGSWGGVTSSPSYVSVSYTHLTLPTNREG